MRLISLVPSWTETLIECGAEVVGRTRFCIHPEAALHLPVVGGTKQIDFAKAKALRPEWFILDQEENPKIIAQSLEVPYFASHLETAHDMPAELERLALCLKSDLQVAKNLRGLAGRWQRVLDVSSVREINSSPPQWENLPGVIEWWRKPEFSAEAWPFLYLIWKNPYMAIGTPTFIASVFEILGWGARQIHFSAKYPKLESPEHDVPAFFADKILLFSSEPYPFAREKEVMKAEFNSPMALVDGEAFSWFGLRALQFLEKYFEIQP